MKTFGDHLDQYREYQQEIAEFTYLSRNTHTPIELGVVDGNPIYLFEAKTPNGVLVTSGWQGDEPAGWGASKVLCEKFPAVSFLPFASPACFLTRQHKNDYGRNVDRNWPEVVTPEGKVLKSKLKDLVRLGSRCFVSLQEDGKRFVPYYYGWSITDSMSATIAETLKNHFPTYGEIEHTPPDRGLFCEYMKDQGCAMAVQIETPADGSYTISQRIGCQVDVVSSLITLNF